MSPEFATTGSPSGRALGDPNRTQPKKYGAGDPNIRFESIDLPIPDRLLASVEWLPNPRPSIALVVPSPADYFPHAASSANEKLEQIATTHMI